MHKRILLITMVLGTIVLLGLSGIVWYSAIPMSFWRAHPIESWYLSQDNYPDPIIVRSSKSESPSAMAQLGARLFYDKSLSGSGKQSCASCHEPQNSFQPPVNDMHTVMLGGTKMNRTTFRVPPSLAYLYRQPNFSIHPTSLDDEDTPVVLSVTMANDKLSQKIANNSKDVETTVPKGGLFWDGRVNTLQQQANFPLFSPDEMDAGSIDRVASILEHSSYASQFKNLFGENIFQSHERLVSEALFAIGRYEFEAPEFHLFNSKYDSWIQGKIKLSQDEIRGYLAFSDAKHGNCAACHLSRPSKEGVLPLFTDHEYEALGVPRNEKIPANNDSEFFDLGLCGPSRTDLKEQSQYCGMFRTPSLRNTAKRKVYFHNGVYQTLEQVLQFYNQRDLEPQKIYKFSGTNDLPKKYHPNIDHLDAPFNRKKGDPLPMSEQDMKDIIVFLKTLNDGFVAEK